MNGKLKNILLPAIAVGLMVVGANGLKETTYGANYAEVPVYYQPMSPVKIGANLYNEVHLDEACEDLKPSFTFIVHGIGGSASNWSNDLYYDCNNASCIGSGGFAWNNKSLLYKITQENDAAIYRAKYEGNNHFNFYRYDEAFSGNIHYAEQPNKRNYLSETLSHNVIVYESNNGMQSLTNEFNNFEYVVNTICYDYKKLHGFVPKINLIGHSRGGLVTQKYLNKYPYNVSGIYNIATPYNGTTSLDLAETIASGLGSLLGDAADYFEFSDPAYQDLKNEDTLAQIKSDWNELKNPNNPSHQPLALRGHAYAGVLTIPYLKQLVRSACQAYSVPVQDDVIQGILDILDDINNFCKTNSGEPNYNFNTLLNYRDYTNARTKFTGISKTQLINLINNDIEDFVDDYLDAILDDVQYMSIPIVRGIVKFFANTFVIDSKLDFFEENVTPFLVDSIASFDGKVGIFENDVLVDLDSQWCDGYLGYDTFVKVYDANYLQTSIITPTANDVLVGHNLETFDHDITRDIADDAKFPNYNELHYNIVTGDSNGLATYNPLQTGPIAQTVKVFVIDGNELGNGLTINPYVKIIKRSTPLTIRLKNFNTTVALSSANVDKPFIEYTGNETFNLTIEYDGSNSFKYNSSYARGYNASKPAVIDCKKANVIFEPCTSMSSLNLKAANGANGVFESSFDKPNKTTYDNDTRDGDSGENGTNGNPGGSGSNCIECNDLNLKLARNLTVQGGYGGSGSRGGNGGGGANGRTRALGYKGGDGGNGGNGGNGGWGGSGGYPFHCYSVTMGSNNYSTSNVNLYPGKPGNGGRGGNGGNGGHGANGTYFQFLWSVTNHDGGNGGNGGKVGYGGDSGYAYFDGSSVFDLYYTNYSLYIAMVNNCSNYYSASGGLGGSKFGNGGNAGRRSNTKSDNSTPRVDGDGIEGKAVTAYNQLNNLYRECSTLLTTKNGQSYFITNGLGKDSNNNYKYYSTQPTYGKNGQLKYFYNE